MCDLDPKVKVKGKKAGICDGVPSTAALDTFCHRKIVPECHERVSNSLDPDL